MEDLKSRFNNGRNPFKRRRYKLEIPVFALDNRVLSSSAFRLYCIFLLSKHKRPLQRSQIQTRGNLARITRLSYNTIQGALRELSELKLVVPDPFDYSKTSFIVNESNDFNWELIRERIGINLKPSLNTDETKK